MPKELKNIIREERLNKGLNQPELAKILNVTKQTISNWENGNRIPDANTLSKLSELFDCSVDYLLGRTDKRNNSIFDGTGQIRDLAETYEAELTRKDEKDVEKLLNQTMEYIENQEGLMLNGEILDEDDLLLLKQAVKNGLEYAKISNKKKYTPKKYRKDNK